MAVAPMAQRHPFYFFADLRITCADGSVHPHTMIDYVRAFNREEAEAHCAEVIESLLDAGDEAPNLPSGGIAAVEIKGLEWMS